MAEPTTSMADPARPPARGVIFTATGDEKYVRLAERAAHSIRTHNPGLAIDLYTDVARDLPVFDAVHVLGNVWERSRIDAMRLSRFERTLALDCDTIIVGAITDLFDLLDRFDIAAAHDQWRNGAAAQKGWKKQLPAAFAEFNGGVIVLRKSAGTDRFLEDWARAVREHAIGRDQPTFRELLWDSDLRIATLPPEYNLMTIGLAEAWDPSHPAPKILHSPQFHREFDRYSNSADPVTERLGLRLGWKMRQWNGLESASGWRGPLRKTAWMARRVPGRVLVRMRRRVGW